MYLLATDVLVELLAGNEQVKEFLNGLTGRRGDSFSISIISRFEVVKRCREGRGSVKKAELYCDYFENLPVDEKVVGMAVRLVNRAREKSINEDLLIAATAKKYKRTLLTFDRTFKNLLTVPVRLILRSLP